MRLNSCPRSVVATAVATFAFLLLPDVGAAAASGGQSEDRAAWELPPGWTETRGGEGGRVMQITTLAASGEGSLAAALAAEGPRTIEFAVAGTIDLGGRSIPVKQPHLTIAGETAPSPGVTLTNGGINISTHDVVVRHIRIRPGAGTRAKKSGWEIDGLATAGGAHDVIVDHCSITWSTDENLSASGPRFEGATPEDWRKNTSHRITFSHCIIGEGLHNSSHAKGPHSMGSLIHDNTSDIAIIGNLYISNNARNPLFKGGARGAVVNNLIHNPGRMAMAYALVAKEWEGHEWQRGMMVVAGNAARKGASTALKLEFLSVRGPCDVYMHDNQYFDPAGKPLSAEKAGGDDLRWLDQPPFWPPRLKARPANETAAWVLAHAGARPWERDAVDRRLIEEANSGGGKIIHSEAEVGGLPGDGQ